MRCFASLLALLTSVASCSAPDIIYEGTGSGGVSSGGGGTAGGGGVPFGGGAGGSDASAGTGGGGAAGAGGGSGAGGSHLEASVDSSQLDAGCNPISVSTVLLNPGTITQFGSGSPWSVLDNATMVDDKETWAALTSSSANTRELRTSGYNAKLPSNAKVEGIRVKVVRKALMYTGNVRDLTVQLMKGGTPISVNKANLAATWGKTHSTATYGGKGDLWNTPWTVAEVNAATFGVALAASCPSPCQADQARIDHIGVEVIYSMCK